MLQNKRDERRDERSGRWRSHCLRMAEATHRLADVTEHVSMIGDYLAIAAKWCELAARDPPRDFEDGGAEPVDRGAPALGACELGNVVTVAEHLSRRMGPNAAQVIAARALEHDAEGAKEDAEFWRRVTIAMTELREISIPAQDPAAPAQVRHELLVEHKLSCIAHAMEAERKAAMPSDALQAEMLELARRWRELARQAQLLAEQMAPAERHDGKG